MTLVAGVDVGGTKVEACIADPVTGVVHARERIATRVECGGAAVLEDCVSLVLRVRRGVSIAAVGVGICELVDLDGRVNSADTIDWRDLDIGRAFRDIAPVRVDSDVRAAALAEVRFGAGRRCRQPWLYVTVGTGVSFCLVIDGRPYAGAHGHALVVGAPPVELLASGRALERQSKYDCAADVLADSACAPLVERGARALGNAFALLANALDPALIVVGGGLGLIDDYRDRATGFMRAQIEADDTRNVPVIAAELGSLAGPLGAAVVAAPAAADSETMVFE